MSDSFMISRSSPPILTSVPDHLPNRIKIACLDIEWYELACFVTSAGAYGDDFAFLWLFLGSIRNDDAACSLCFGFDAAYYDAVVKRAELGLGHG